MHRVKTRKIVLGFMAVAVAAGALVVPDPAEAALALFRTQRKTWTVLPTTHPTYTVYTVDPPSMGTRKRPSAVATIGTTTPVGKITLPSKFASWFGTYFCSPKACWEGYPISGGTYSYWNAPGHFRQNNPYGATMHTTIWFPTLSPSASTMYTQTGMQGQWLANGLGDPVTPTTTWGGRYDFSRGGTIQVTPGPNRFGGTMNFITGPNARFYQLITINTPYVSKATGTTQDVTGEMYLGQKTWSGNVTRVRVTPTPTITTTTTTTPMGGTVMSTFTTYKFTTLKTTGGDPVYSAVGHYIATNAVSTTGMLYGYAPAGTYQTKLTHTGYDNRTPDGLSGNLSLINARLRHTYLVTNNPLDPITTNYNSVRMYEMLVMFAGEAPEPGVMLLLGVGIVTLAGLVHLRRR